MTQGFTLIELLLVVVIIGIVAAFVLPKFGDVKKKAYVSAMKNDLRNLATDQEIFFDNNGEYRPADNGMGDPDAITKVPTSENVHLNYGSAENEFGNQQMVVGQDGYIAYAWHDKSDTRCAMNRTNETQDKVAAGSVDDFMIGTMTSGELKCEEF